MEPFMAAMAIAAIHKSICKNGFACNAKGNSV